MTRRVLTIALLSILTAGCADSALQRQTTDLQERLRNPLVAERYWSEMAEHMADFFRHDDPLSKDPVKSAIIDAQRLRALERVEQARTLKREGISGLFLDGKEEALGEALLRDSTLSFSTTFFVNPNPETRVYLTTIVDPRDTAFPDATAVDLGSLQTPYGDQEYVVPEDRMDPRLRTVVLYDRKLERVLGFAQLSK